jgi:RimJ/RimL family protein N-acetyltransferase
VLRADGPIHTARLVLRPFAPGDLDDLYDYQSRPDVARYLHWEARDRDQAREALEQQRREVVLARADDWLTYAVALPESGKVIGEVGLKWLSPEHRQGEIGFVFNPDHGGRGLATEAAEVMLRLGFDDLGLHRIVGSCMAQNAQSARLMERLGMRREAHFIHNEIIKGEWADELVYAILDFERRAPQVATRPR